MLPEVRNSPNSRGANKIREKSARSKSHYHQVNKRVGKIRSCNKFASYYKLHIFYDDIIIIVCNQIYKGTALTKSTLSKAELCESNPCWTAPITSFRTAPPSSMST